MTILKSNGSLFNQLPMLFDDFLNRDLYKFGLSDSETNTTIPAVNIKETAEHYC